MERHILIVDDEINILNAIERSLEEHEEYEIYRANCADDGLEIIKSNPEIGVVISDQRMPNKTGIEFLKEVRQENDNIVRIILSGYAEMGSIIQSINEGAVFKFITKPWEEEQLLQTINESFEYYELSEQNRRLTKELKESNEKLAKFNAQLEQRVEEKTRDLSLHVQSLRVYQDAIEHFPFAIMALDDTNSLVLENNAARVLFSPNQTSQLGLAIDAAFNHQWQELQQLLMNNTLMADLSTTLQVDINGHQLNIAKLIFQNQSQGRLIFAIPTDLTGTSS